MKMPRCNKCGMVYRGNFCPNCGERAGGVTASRQAYVRRSALNRSRVYSALGFVPAVCLALFAVLAFAFLAAPVDADELFGNAYSLLEEPYDEKMKAAVIATLVFASVEAVFAIVSLALTFSRYHRNVGVRLKNGVNFSSSRIVSLTGSSFYLIMVIIGGAMIGIVSEDGVFKAGACPALLVAFSIVFAVLITAEEIAHVVMSLKFPDCKRSEDEFIALVAEYTRRLPPPALPAIPAKLTEKYANKNWSETELRKRLRRAGKRRVMASILVSILFLEIYGLGIIILIICLLSNKKIRYYRAEKAYERRVKKFEEGKNYTGVRGFNKWLMGGRG